MARARAGRLAAAPHRLATRDHLGRASACFVAHGCHGHGLGFRKQAEARAWPSPCRATPGGRHPLPPIVVLNEFAPVHPSDIRYVLAVTKNFPKRLSKRQGRTTNQGRRGWQRMPQARAGGGKNAAPAPLGARATTLDCCGARPQALAPKQRATLLATLARAHTCGGAHDCRDIACAWASESVAGSEAEGRGSPILISRPRALGPRPSAQGPKAQGPPLTPQTPREAVGKQ